MNLPGLILTTKFFSFLIASWLFVHLMAVLGIFSALIYPVWYFLVPKRTMCFICRIKNNGDYCFFCRKKVKKEDGDYPKSLTSIFLNSSLILIFSFVSLGIIFVESNVLFALGFPPTSKTVSFFIPAKGQYRLGEVFPMDIQVIGVKVPINAVQVDLSFNPSKIELIDFSTKDSFANVFIQKEINNEVGYARLTGGLTNPGFFGPQGLFAKAYFKSKEPGIVKIDFLPTSIVFANDGKGTNVLKEFSSTSYLILSDEISEEERERQKIIFQQPVLGEKTDNLQLRFYEEDRVLGTQAAKKQINPEKVPEEEKKDYFEAVLKTIEKIDTIILVFWKNIFIR